MSCSMSLSPARRQRGVALLEVLIAVLILSIGLLGIAALQAQALRNTQSAHERGQAVILSYSIFDAMRADPSGNYDTGGFLCAAPAGATLRDRQLADWIDSLGEGLGAGACGEVDCNAGECTVSVRWNDARGTDGSTTQVIETRSRL